jgi:alkylation response protein AidB-like acyl-CoA dehydrogenase
MNLGVSAEQRELREAVRRFLAERVPLTRVRELMETAAGTDPDVWRQASAQLGRELFLGDGGYHRERLAGRIGL